MRGIGVFGFWAVRRGAGGPGKIPAPATAKAKTKQNLPIRDVESGIEVMGKINGVPSIAALGGQGGERNGMGAECDDVIGTDHALIAEAEAVLPGVSYSCIPAASCSASCGGLPKANLRLLFHGEKKASAVRLRRPAPSDLLNIRSAY